MSLRVWLPLNGDLRNNGLDNITVTNNGATVDNNGKIGKCYSFDGTNDNIVGTYTATEEISFCCWVYFNTIKNGHVIDARIPASGVGYQPMYITASSIQIGCSSSNYPSYSFTWEVNKWYHICVVHNVNGGKCYIDGDLIGETSAAKGVDLGSCVFKLGSRCSNSNYSNVKLNDFRIYDHALSVKEIKEISKGLVCHYKLDSRYSTDNLILNGFGESGTENWTSNTLISTTEIPSGHSEIKASYYNGNMIKEYIPINPNHSYTISAYLKTTGATSGTTYPSIYPYDYDKKFIWTYNCTEGFSNTYKTTLAQPLKKGDTVIYATNLSAWITAGTNYYFHVAIFGYKDSSGYTYPDMIYTADSPVFGTKADKSHIDKTNNTITLNAPFTGEDRPAGTTICQATEGATYYYPFGGCGLGGLQDWTFKTATFTPKSHNRLKACKYIRWQAYSGAYYAGNKLIDNNDNNAIVYDCSGYNHHAVINGDITITPNTPRNSLATHFTSGSYIRLTDFSSADFANSYTFSWWGKFTQTSNHMMWGYSNGNRLNLYMMGGNFYWNTGDGGSNPFNVSASTYADNMWHHMAVTGDGTTTKLYIDGEFKNNAKTYKPITGTILVLNGWDTGTQYKFNGDLSDFRIYATALSADDVKELYQTSASIDKDGNVFAYEYKED